MKKRRWQARYSVFCVIVEIVLSLVCLNSASGYIWVQTYYANPTNPAESRHSSLCSSIERASDEGKWHNSWCFPGGSVSHHPFVD